jgi:peptidyl-prolyl isomerase E (cyclophilin E)
LTGKNRGFGFVQFEEIEDAEDAMDNMHNAELFGRVLTVNIAKAQSIKLGYHRPVWADADSFYSKLKEDGADTRTDAQQSSKQAE